MCVGGNIMIYYKNKEIIIEEGPAANVIKLSENYMLNDILVFDGEEPEYYEVDRDGVWARKSLVLYNGLSEIELSIFTKRFKMYREVANIETTLREYPQYAIDDFNKSFMEAIDRVEKHNHLDETQKHIIIELYINNVRKKDLVSNGVCTFEDIEKAIGEILHELPYCYGFINKAILHRANEYNNGNAEFLWDLDEFCKFRDITNQQLEKLERRVIAKIALSDESKNRFTAIIDCLHNGEIVSIDDKNYIFDLIPRIQEKAYAERKNIYLEHIKIMEEKGWVSEEYISKYAVANGLHIKRLMHELGHLGYKTHHHRRRKPLSDYLND